MILEGRTNIIDFDPFQTRTEADASHKLGEEVRLADGRVFQHIKAGASNISKGKLQLSPAPKTNHANLAVSAASAGAVQVSATLGATAATADEYGEGYLVVNAGPGLGQSYKIKGNPAIAQSVAGLIDLFDPINVALTTASKVTLVHNACNAVVEAAVATRRAAGVPLIDLLAGDYGWGQKRGVAGVLADVAVAVGNAIVPSDAVAGAVEQQDVFVNATDATRLDAKEVVGRADIIALVDQENRPVFLAIN